MQVYIERKVQSSTCISVYTVTERTYLQYQTAVTVIGLQAVIPGSRW